MGPPHGTADDRLFDLLRQAHRIVGEEHGALPLVLLRLARRRPEDGDARAALNRLLLDRANSAHREGGRPA
jgi:hypothetical protein